MQPLVLLSLKLFHLAFGFHEENSFQELRPSEHPASDLVHSFSRAVSKLHSIM